MPPNGNDLNLAVQELRASNNLLSEILKLREPLLPEQMNFAQRLTQLKKQSFSPISIIRVNLSTARNDEPFRIAGNVFYILRIIDTAGADATGNLQVKFIRNDQVLSPLLAAGQGIRTDFDTVFITNTAQSGVIAEVLIATDDRFQFIDNRLSTSISSITTITTLVNLTGTIAGVTTLPATATRVTGTARSAHTGTALTDIATVTAGKTLIILDGGVSLGTNIAGDNTVELIIANASDVFQWKIAQILTRGTDVGGSQAIFPKLCEVPAGFKVRLRKQAAGADSTNNDGHGWFYGYEI